MFLIEEIARVGAALKPAYVNKNVISRSEKEQKISFKKLCLRYCLVGLESWCNYSLLALAILN